MPTYLGLNLGLNFWEDFSDPTGLLSVMRAGLSLRFVLCLDGARDPNIIQSSQDIIIKHTHHPTHTQFFHAYRINVYHCISQNAKFGTSLLFSTRSDPSCFWIANPILIIFKSLRFTVCTSHAWVLSDWSKCTSDDCTNAEYPPDLCGGSEGAFKKPNKQINENNDKWGTFLNFSENPATLFFLVDADLSADRLFMFPKHLTLQQFFGQNVPCLSEELEPEVVMLCCWGTSWRSLWRSEACDVLRVSQLYQI